MARNALLDETRDAQWPVALPGFKDKQRLPATIAAILDQHRPDTLGKGDQLVHGALKTALIEGIVAGRFRQVHDALGAILGVNACAASQSDPELPSREADPSREVRKPLAKAGPR